MNIKKPIILCVDDVPENLDLLETLLSIQGYEVLKAEDGIRALKVIESCNIDLVLLDINMPGMDGYEVCRNIKRNEKYRNIPVIMLTSLSSKKDRITGIEAGAEDFINKPFYNEEILSRIKMLLKMKDLNDKLVSAYGNITNLISFGELILKNFNPLDFDFISKIDKIVTQILGINENGFENPETVLVGYQLKNSFWEWFRYHMSDSELVRNVVTTKFEMFMEHPKNTVYLNEKDISTPALKAFRDKVSETGIDIKNMVSYFDNTFCMMAMNYGREVTNYDVSVLKGFVMQSLFLKSLSIQVIETENAFDYLVNSISRAAEAKDEETGGHILRVGNYCSILARKMGMRDDFIRNLIVQAQLHDVGKIHIASNILKKPGKLTDEEMNEIYQHTIYGARIIGEHPRLVMARTIALTHHEKWDGSGYPYGLKGDQIPIEGRIASIADQYDAMRNPRVYKPAFDHYSTCKIIIEGDGRTKPEHFDPEILEVFKKISDFFNEVFEKMDDTDKTA